jgi:hypothetical protein
MNTAITPYEHYVYQVLRSFARDGIKKVTEADIAAKLDYGMESQLQRLLPILKVCVCV